MTTEGNTLDENTTDEVVEATEVTEEPTETSATTQNLADMHFPVVGNSARRQRSTDIENFIKWIQGILDDDLARNPYGNRHYYDGAVAELQKTKQELIDIQAEVK
jgi:hypothetical protein